MRKSQNWEKKCWSVYEVMWKKTNLDTFIPILDSFLCYRTNNTSWQKKTRASPSMIRINQMVYAQSGFRFRTFAGCIEIYCRIDWKPKTYQMLSHMTDTFWKLRKHRKLNSFSSTVWKLFPSVPAKHSANNKRLKEMSVANVLLFHSYFPFRLFAASR